MGNPRKPYDTSPDMVGGAVRAACCYLRHRDLKKVQRLATRIANRFKDTK